MMQDKKEPRLWSERFLGFRAKWFALPIAGFFIFMQALAHDRQIYYSVAHGESDINAYTQLYFSNWSDAQDVQLIITMAVCTVALAGLAIFIRYARWHYANHGIALD